MKKSTILLLVLILLPCIVQATDTSTSVPTGSQYKPSRNYGFQISCGDVPNVTNATLVFNGNSYLAGNTSFNFYYNISNLPAADYAYSWVVMNETDTLAFPGTYNIAKNTSVQISLTLDGTAGDKSYKNNTAALFVASLPLTNKLVKLETTYPGFETLTNATSSIRYSLTLTSVGLFTATASWNGDENYTGSSISYNFDDSPSQITNLITTPESPVGYIPSTNYRFQATFSDATLTSVWFESNYTGTMKSYYANSEPEVQNSSGNFWIELGKLSARNFTYRWHAKDSLNQETATEFFRYYILKMNPLVVEILPSSGIVEGTQVTATCFSINPNEINTSNFYFYKDREMIKSISYSTRMEMFLMTSGEHDFTCKTNGTGNYTNQSITRIISVTAKPQPEQKEVEGILEVSNVSFQRIPAGGTGEASFLISNGLLRNVINIAINITGIPGDWYFLEKPYFVNRNETKVIKISISIPLDAEGKTYPVSIRMTGKTTDERSIDTIKATSIEVIGQKIDEPPHYTDTISQSMNGSDFVITMDLLDDNGLSGYIFSSNATGVWENDSWAPLSGRSGTISVVKALSQASSSVAWKVYANDSNNQWSQTEELAISPNQNHAAQDSSIVLIIIGIVIILAAATIIMLARPKEPEVEYIFKKEDINEES